MNPKIQKILVSVLVLIGGIVFIFLGLKGSADLKKFKEVKVTVTGVDRTVTRDKDDGSETEEITVHVKYKVDGKEYKEILNSAPSNAKEGETITAHYNPENPKEVTGATKGSNTIFIIVGIIAALAGLVCGVFFFIRGR